MDATAAQTEAAYRSLEDGRVDDALRQLDGVGDDCPVRASIRLAVFGLIADRDGDAAAAATYFEQVYKAGVPLPALLRDCGRYFKRSGRYDVSYHCYSILQKITHGAIQEFLAGLPPRELSRYSPWIVPRVLGDFYALQPTKEALARTLGPPGAAMAYAHLTGNGSDWDVVRLPLASLQDYARKEALLYEELVAGREVYLPPPAVFAGPPPLGLEARSRSFFLCVLADVRVSSKSNFLLTAEHALLDYQNDEVEKYPLNLDVDPSVIAADQGLVTMFIDERVKPLRRLDQAFTLVGVHSHTFGHWIGEFLPKLWACLDRPDFQSVPILIDERMPYQHAEALRFFAGTEHSIVVLKQRESVHVNRLWACSTVYYSPVGPKPGVAPAPGLFALDTKAFAGLVDRIRPLLAQIERPSGPRRLYLARRDDQQRRMANRQEIEAWLAAQDFAIVDFEHITFYEQLKLIRGADLIMGPNGSAFFMTFFARPGTRIGVFSPPALEHFVTYSKVYDDLGCHFAVLPGDVVHEDAGYRGLRSDYRIDLTQLAEFLGWLL